MKKNNIATELTIEELSQRAGYILVKGYNSPVSLTEVFFFDKDLNFVKMLPANETGFEKMRIRLKEQMFFGKRVVIRHIDDYAQKPDESIIIFRHLHDKFYKLVVLKNSNGELVQVYEHYRKKYQKYDTDPSFHNQLVSARDKFNLNYHETVLLSDSDAVIAHQKF